MEIETLEYNTLLYDHRQVDASLISINLSDIMRILKQSLSFSKKNIIAVALLNEPEKKIVITAVHENSDIEFLKSANSVSVQVIEGVLVFRTRKESVTLNPGMMLTVGEDIPFRLKSLEEALFLVTLKCKNGKVNTDVN
jgi:hypothetical protein